MGSRTGCVVAGALVCLAAAACGSRRQLPGSVSTSSGSAACLRCHGGGDNQTGAPPVSVTGQRDTASSGVGAHTAHVTAGPLAGSFECSQCHPDPRLGSTVHGDGQVELAFGALATAGGRLAPAFDTATNRCSNVYCHGATLAGGSHTTPVWTRVGAGEAACGTCHGVPPPAPHPDVSGGLPACNACHPQTVDATGAVIPAPAGGKHLDGHVDAVGHGPDWMDASSPGFHAFSANAGVAACQACHGAALDGGTVGLACASCHSAAGPASDFSTCTACHGSADGAGAPPKATWGHAGDPSRGGGALDAVRVGAHTAHVTASAVAPAFGCEVCHVKPASLVDPGHVDGPTATVTFQGLALRGVGQGNATWDRAGATCAGTYCHGNFPGGKSSAPVWTGGPAQGACGSCHDLPPAAPHPAITGGLTACSACHPTTIDAAGDLVPPASGGQHLDGQIEFTGGHGASWMDQASPGFHAYSADRGLASCQFCHGALLDGVGGSTTVGCQSCHGASWRTSCTMCHGGSDNPTGAPPRTTWGQGGDAVRVGAHTVHLAGGPLAPAFGCEVCHLQPSDALSPGHVDGVTATVTFGGLAVQGAAPLWTRAAATCAGTYCHGAFRNGNAANAPVWTGGAAQAACGTCHGVPPPSPHPAVSGGTAACNPCHDQSIDPAGQVIPPAAGGKHLDGVIEATGHGPDWMNQASPGFHAFSADRGLASCQGCHGAALDGGATGVACASCHGGGWQIRCTMCHGGADNQTGAPPAAIWGYAGDPNRGGGALEATRVGAHTAHLTGSALAPPFDCGLCHVKPGGALDVGHVDAASGPAPLATVVFSGLAAQGTSAAWSRATGRCNTYCHGATLGGGSNTAPLWTDVGAGEAACGTCHGLPPPKPHPTVSGGLPACNGCHPQTVDPSGAVVPPSAGGQHLDGTVQAIGHGPDWMNTASPGFHAFAADQGLADCQGCHGADLEGGAVGVACAKCHGTGWKTTCTMCHGGVDSRTGAPPSPTWGHGDPNRGGGTPDPIRVGAHTVHLAGGPLAGPFDCAVCHVVPADALAPGHVDQATATVTFGGRATLGTSAAPTWSRGSATCSGTYCHGATTTRGTNTAPVWTGGAGQAACGACHGTPPDTGQHFSHVVSGGIGANLPCSWCHAGFTEASVDAALHVNGVRDVIVSPAAAATPADAYRRITGWDATGCHAAVACHGMMP